MQVTFTITATVQRIEGKFAPKDDIRDYLRDEIEGMNPGEVDGVGADGDTRYEITDWTVEDVN